MTGPPPETPPRPHVVIVGGGFGGLYAARALARAPVRITLLDRRNYHLFQPLLYQVATGTLNPSDIAAPIRWVLRRQPNTTVILGEAQSIDPSAKRVLLEDGELPFDYLILATGAAHSYFGHDAWEADAPGLKTIEDALDIRKRVYFAFEAAERESDPVRQNEWLTFAVVGGGPTGVELAGALAEVARHTLPRDFRRIDSKRARIVLVESLPRILGTYPEELQRKAVDQLVGLGVEVKSGTRVTSIDSTGLSFEEGRISARTVLWAAGVQASSIGRTLGVALDRAGRVRVTPELTVPGHDGIFVAGDLAAVESEGRPVPGVAPAAMQMGRHCAGNIVRAIRGLSLQPFRYVDKGELATIGRSAAIARIGSIRLSGFTAWMAWLLLHITYLIGFRNRAIVLLDWAWAYFTLQRGSRLITGTLPNARRGGTGAP